MKIFELADPHINPKWLESQKPVLYTIVETGKKEKPDIICIAGDIYDRPFYNSEKDNITYVREFMRNLLLIAPVVSYGIFEEMGCHVLHPAKPEIINGCLFIGLPEIDKTHFMAKNNLKIQETNEKLKTLITQYITRYWVPVRQANKDIPCVFLGHGIFVDNPNDNNPIIQNSDIIIDNNILKEIQADRYIFGHFHTPSESKVLNGGYVGFTGFDRSPWNSTGFQPGFNVTEIDINCNWMINEPPGFLTETKRIDYPVIRKEKFTLKVLYNKTETIVQALDNFVIRVKYKNTDLRIKLPIKKKSLLKINIKEWQDKLKIKFNLNSCEIVPDIIKEESQRITQEQAEKLHTLWQKYCFFKNWEENSHKTVMTKIYEIEKNVSSNVQQMEKKKVKLNHLEVYGSIFSKKSYGKKCLSHDFSKDPPGLTLIQAKNGGCKSTYFGFASPYPVFLGWDYRSLKEFFPEGGRIIKWFVINEILHEHLIIIPEDHKKKILCYWNIDIDTQPKARLKQQTVKEFMQECEKFFGPISSFVSTSFFAQEPWRMKNYVSSIVSSTSTELRNAYLEIVGISREQEKEYAHNKVSHLKTEIRELEIKKNTMSEILADKEDVEKESDKLKVELNNLDSDIGVLVYEENEKQKKFNDVKKQYEEQQKLAMELHNLKNKLNDCNNDLLVNAENIKKYKKINIDELKQRLTDNDKIKKSIELLREDWQRLNDIKEKTQKEIDGNEKKLRNCDRKGLGLNNQIDVNKINKTKYVSENNLLSKPCFYCKKIPHPENEKIINDNLEIIKNLNNKNKELISESSKVKESIELYKKNIKQLLLKLPSEELNHITEQAAELKEQLLKETEILTIQNSINEYSKITVYQENLEKLKDQISQIELNMEAIKGKQNPFTESLHNDVERELSGLQNQIKEKQNTILSKKGMLKAIKEQLEKIYKYEKELQVILGNLDKLVLNLSDWEIIEKDMMSNKLPALELQLIAEEIDYEVNQKLKGKYIIKTETQEVNKKGDIIDRFDIKIYDPKSGIESSLIEFSPGERAAYFIEPISQALRERRQKKENIEFMYSVGDETDNFVIYEKVREYFEIMNQGLPEEHTRFVMSQKSEIYQYIKNTINMEDIVKNT
jgi:hypothetical protein